MTFFKLIPKLPSSIWVFISGKGNHEKLPLSQITCSKKRSYMIPKKPLYYRILLEKANIEYNLHKF